MHKPKPDEIDYSGLNPPETLEELERLFEPCGGFLRRKGCTVQKPSILYDAPKLLALVRKMKDEGKL